MLSTVIIALLLAIGIALATSFLASTGKPRPPGPKQHFGIGNLLDMPSKQPWIKFTEWKDRYGEVVHVNALGRDYVILNSMEAIKELLEKRGSVYSDRPTSMMTGELVGLSQGLVLLRYGEKWKIQRKLAKQGLSPEAVEQFTPILMSTTMKFLQAMRCRPHSFMDELRLASGRNILGITYGYDVKNRDDPLLRDIEKVIEVIGKTGTPRAYLIEVIPALKHIPHWLPFATFKRVAEEGRQLCQKVIDEAYNRVKKDMENGRANPSFTTNFLCGYESLDEEYEFHLKWTAGNLCQAGAETTFSITSSFFLAMVLYPDVMKRAQEELDSVIGVNGLPTLHDRPRLPYFNSVLKEVFRWKAPAPLGVAHRNQEQDVYKGWTIPPGATIVPNIWAISQDVLDPDCFNPERWLSNETGKRIPDPYEYAFGFGRRICPGQLLALNSLFLMLSSFVSLFDISKPDDFKYPKIKQGVIVFPLDFKCEITVRPTRSSLLTKLFS